MSTVPIPRNRNRAKEIIAKEITAPLKLVLLGRRVHVFDTTLLRHPTDYVLRIDRICISEHGAYSFHQLKGTAGKKRVCAGPNAHLTIMD